MTIFASSKIISAATRENLFWGLYHQRIYWSVYMSVCLCRIMGAISLSSLEILDLRTIMTLHSCDPNHMRAHKKKNFSEIDLWLEILFRASRLVLLIKTRYSDLVFFIWWCFGVSFNFSRSVSIFVLSHHFLHPYLCTLSSFSSDDWISDCNYWGVVEQKGLT